MLQILAAFITMERDRWPSEFTAMLDVVLKEVLRPELGIGYHI